MGSLQVVLPVLTVSCFLTTINALLASHARDQGLAVFSYPKNVYSERDLGECPQNAACSVIYRRFWLPPIVERNCRCPAQSECPWAWADIPDNQTLTLNNRAQFKFCSSLENLKKCSTDELALQLGEHAPHHKSTQPKAVRQKVHKRTTDDKTVIAYCQCFEPHFWEPILSSDLNYQCSPLSTCNEDDICGYVRTDLFSNYYRCSCPIGQQCVTQDKRTHFQKLLLYTGPVYTAHCTRVYNDSG